MSATHNPLPDTFTFRQAIAAGLTRHELYRMLDEGKLERIAHGLYHRSDSDWGGDIDLIEITMRAPDATLCLTSALARHGLTDEIPGSIDIALPRGRWHPATVAPVTWHSFDPETFDIGRESLSLDDTHVIGIYSPERCIIDAFRLRHREGSDLAISATKAWLRQPGHHPAALLDLAQHFPKALPPLRTTLETILA
jgi:predicted transcriptional regulator of viral defense system